MSAPVATTTRLPFFSLGSTTGELFEVRAGLPALTSLEQASCLLASCYQTLVDVADEPNPEIIYGAAHLAMMAKSVVDSVVAGLLQQQELRA